MGDAFRRMAQKHSASSSGEEIESFLKMALEKYEAACSLYPSKVFFVVVVEFNLFGRKKKPTNLRILNTDYEKAKLSWAWS